jgi:endoglucanase
MNTRTMLAALLLLAGQAGADEIRVNQLGFLPGASKLAVVPDGAASDFSVVDTASGRTVLRAALGPAALWAPAGEKVKLADFSALRRTGEYRIKVDGMPDSQRFSIRAGVYRKLGAAALKGFYYNRSGSALLARHAGVYARAAGHPDTRVLVHASAASPARPEGSVIASPKGWYDAGDYNKYVVNSGIATYTLLAAYEHFPTYFTAQHGAIPESGNLLPDILNEAMWNLEWMLSMQDPNDGGVYHKLTNQAFDAFVMPDQARTARYVVQKSTAATLDFAATMATASRVLAPFDAQAPGRSARMMAAAEAAWQWAQANPAQLYRQPADILTGEYGDAHVDDEFAWAAAELFIGTGKDSYYLAMKPGMVTASVPAWDDVRGLAWISLAHHRARLAPIADRVLIARRIETLAQQLRAGWRASSYRLAMQPDDFVWGSNAVALNQAIMLLQAYRLTGQRDNLRAAQSALDYVLGRNPTGYSYVTGYGALAPRHPHHRPSQADQVVAPVPGLLVGGAQAGQQDRKECADAYPSALPAKSYLDRVCSYASNEIAINWNAPLVYVAAALGVLTGSGR